MHKPIWVQAREQSCGLSAIHKKKKSSKQRPIQIQYINIQDFIYENKVDRK
jgi:hypothetical protein